ncbi:MAG TPA: hypothetical protein VGG62_10215, partial [Terracidiphilus sp.]
MDAKTMGKWGMALGPEVVEQIHRRIVAIAREHRVRLTHSELLVSSRVGFAPDSPLEESGFEPLVPLQNQHNRGTAPMSPTASIRVALLIPLANSISISVPSGTSGSNPLSSSGESGANPTLLETRSSE